MSLDQKNTPSVSIEASVRPQFAFIGGLEYTMIVKYIYILDIKNKTGELD